MSNKTVRLNLRLTEEQQKRIAKLMEASDSASMTDTVRRAVAVYEKLLELRSNKQRIIIRNEDGEESDLMLL